MLPLIVPLRIEPPWLLMTALAPFMEIEPSAMSPVELFRVSAPPRFMASMTVEPCRLMTAPLLAFTVRLPVVMPTNCPPVSPTEPEEAFSSAMPALILRFGAPVPTMPGEATSLIVPVLPTSRPPTTILRWLSKVKRTPLPSVSEASAIALLLSLPLSAMAAPAVSTEVRL
ncbi:hypothetical protein D3C71_1663280 [compost metagenome]